MKVHQLSKAAFTYAAFSPFEWTLMCFYLSLWFFRQVRKQQFHSDVDQRYDPRASERGGPGLLPSELWSRSIAARIQFEFQSARLRGVNLKCGVFWVVGCIFLVAANY